MNTILGYGAGKFAASLADSLTLDRLVEEGLQVAVRHGSGRLRGGGPHNRVWGHLATPEAVYCDGETHIMQSTLTPAPPIN